MYRSVLKPTLDLLAALVAFMMLLPIIVLVSILLWISLKGNPFFTQIRPGKDQILFKIIKFRTMSNEKDSSGQLLPDDQRLSGFGALVRKTSLDELPQLLNVLRGDMSLIGPRPLLPEYLPLYSEEQQKRHLVKPGISGYAQVNGRNAISWDKKLALDVDYVEKQSFVLDLTILLQTVRKVFKSEGISAEGHVTMPTFVAFMEQKNKSKV